MRTLRCSLSQIHGRNSVSALIMALSPAVSFSFSEHSWLCSVSPTHGTFSKSLCIFRRGQFSHVRRTLPQSEKCTSFFLRRAVSLAGSTPSCVPAEHSALPFTSPHRKAMDPARRPGSYRNWSKRTLLSPAACSLCLRGNFGCPRRPSKRSSAGPWRGTETPGTMLLHL